MKKKLLSIIISVALILTAAVCIFAFNYKDTQDNVFVIYKSSGEALKTGAEEEEFVTDFNIRYNVLDEGIEVWGDIEGTEFSVKGNFTTISKHGENETSCIALCFEGEDSYENYDVVSMTMFERNTIADITFMSEYFDRVEKEPPEYSNIFTVYLKPKDTEEFFLIEITLEDNFIEAFLEENEESELVYDSKKAWNTVMWFTDYMAPSN